MHMFGQFNYGKKGILDLTHTRLFTFDSLRRLLQESGFVVLSECGIPAPFPHAASNRKLADFLLNVNVQLIKMWKELFSYQIFVVVKPKPSLTSLLKDAVDHSRLKGLALDKGTDVESEKLKSEDREPALV
jgi:hypothetical protein